MMARGRIRPSKPASILGLIVGIGLVLFGVAVGIPTFGAFGVLWTIVAIVITAYSAVNAFTKQGIAEQVVEFDEQTVEERLRRLEDLKRAGVLSDVEYQEQRRRIITEL